MEKPRPLQTWKDWEQFREDIPEKGLPWQFIKDEHQLARYRMEKPRGNVAGMREDERA